MFAFSCRQEVINAFPLCRRDLANKSNLRLRRKCMFKSCCCSECGRELTGAIESTFAREGDFVFIVSRETGDCNWIRCKGCGEVMCKRCYPAKRDYCCDEGRIVSRERIQASQSSHDSFKQLMARSSTILRRKDHLIRSPSQNKNTINRR